MHRVAASIVAAALMAAGAAYAQDQAPSGQRDNPKPRIGDEWGGKKHQPPAAQVRRGEATAGVAQPSAVQQRQTDEVEQLDREIQGRAQQNLRDAPNP